MWLDWLPGKPRDPLSPPLQHWDYGHTLLQSFLNFFPFLSIFLSFNVESMDLNSNSLGKKSIQKSQLLRGIQESMTLSTTMRNHLDYHI